MPCSVSKIRGNLCQSIKQIRVHVRKWKLSQGNTAEALWHGWRYLRFVSWPLVMWNPAAHLRWMHINKTEVELEPLPRFLWWWYGRRVQGLMQVWSSTEVAEPCPRAVEYVSKFKSKVLGFLQNQPYGNFLAFPSSLSNRNLYGPFCPLPHALRLPCHLLQLLPDSTREVSSFPPRNS